MNDIKIHLKKKKEKKEQQGNESYEDLSENGKQKLAEYRKKKYYRMRKSYSFQKWVYIEDILIRINVCIS